MALAGWRLQVRIEETTSEKNFELSFNLSDQSRLVLLSQHQRYCDCLKPKLSHILDYKKSKLQTELGLCFRIGRARKGLKKTQIHLQLNVCPI